jgi:hypothetical protein
MTLFWSVLDLAEPLQIAVFVDRSSSRHFRKFARVAARLLHIRSALALMAEGGTKPGYGYSTTDTRHPRGLDV